jgi:hypothetical protein
MFRFQNFISPIISFAILFFLSGCFAHKFVAKREFDGDQLAWNATLAKAKEFKKAQAADQSVHFVAAHDYFRTGEHVRWFNEFELSAKSASHVFCERQANRLLFNEWEMRCPADSTLRSVVTARPVLGKTVPFIAMKDNEVIADAMLSIPQLLVLDFGDSIALHDSLFWKKSPQKKAVVLLSFEVEDQVREFILKDQGYFKINKRLMNWLNNASSVKLHIYRASSYLISRSDTEDCAIGFFYLEQASTQVEVSKME